MYEDYNFLFSSPAFTFLSDCSRSSWCELIYHFDIDIYLSKWWWWWANVHVSLFLCVFFCGDKFIFKSLVPFNISLFPFVFLSWKYFYIPDKNPVSHLEHACTFSYFVSYHFLSSRYHLQHMPNFDKISLFFMVWWLRDNCTPKLTFAFLH